MSASMRAWNACSAGGHLRRRLHGFDAGVDQLRVHASSSRRIAPSRVGRVRRGRQWQTTGCRRAAEETIHFFTIWCKVCITSSAPPASPTMPPPTVPLPAPDVEVHRWIRRELASAPPRAPSLIITVWGDAIAPHGGAVMLAGLIDLLAPFGINERLVRTSVFRLAREGWLKAKPVGRESLYRLTRDGARRFEQAYRRIYAPPVEGWDESWEIVIADGPAAPQRRALKQELQWEGFGTLGSGVFARPADRGFGRPAHCRGARCRRRHRGRPRERCSEARRPDARVARAGGLGSLRPVGTIPAIPAPLRQGHRSLPDGGQGDTRPRAVPSSCERC